MINSNFRKFIILPVFILSLFSINIFGQDSVGDPVAVLNGLTSGKITAEDFHKQKALTVQDESMNCTIESFNMVWVEKGKDPIEVIMRSGDFNEKAIQLAEKAKTGSVYYFDRVLAKCPTSGEPIKINSLVFKIE